MHNLFSLFAFEFVQQTESALRAHFCVCQSWSWGQDIWRIPGPCVGSGLGVIWGAVVFAT